MKVGVAFCDHVNSQVAGSLVAQQAMKDGGLTRCDLGLIFYTALHDPEALRHGVLSVTGESMRLVGVGGVGAITHDRLGYGGSQVGLALFQLNSVEVDVVSHGRLCDGEETVGRELGRKMKALGHCARATPKLLFYDSVDRSSGRFRLNMATPLLEGLQKELGLLSNLAGAGICGDMAGAPGRQIVDHLITDQQAVALCFSRAVHMDTVILHGCQPASGYRTITKSEGPLVLEIDHRPVLEVIGELLAGQDLAPENYGFFITLGVNKGDKWGDFEEGAYINRMCLRADLRRGGLIMFEPDLVEGTEVQLMHRSLNFDYIAPRVEKAFASLQGRTPVFALYIDCAGRAGAYSGTTQEEATEVQRAVAGRVPMLGFYSGVEIAMVMGAPRPLDWTGVFCLFSVDGSPPS
ncbi:MAG: hypothetical protein A2516_01345 [Alphaproteobacteria bacterium RIFOXYD12_FULL_60_8]|nr:MAG: hypothetical protein A2516_01345 [Alphaproteobacteria bacterium RIFOXYD12_FULL_60_8]